MITGITGNRSCGDLKIFLKSDIEYFKSLLNNADYTELIDQIMDYSGQVPISYRYIVSDLLYALAKTDTKSANLCLSQLRQSQFVGSPDLFMLKFDVLSLDNDEFFNLYECNIRELTVYYEDFYGFNVYCRHCDIDTLNIIGGRGRIESLERSFMTSEIKNTNYL